MNGWAVKMLIKTCFEINDNVASNLNRNMRILYIVSIGTNFIDP